MSATTDLQADVPWGLVIMLGACVLAYVMIIVANYDIQCFRRIVGTMTLEELRDFRTSTERKRALRFGGAIWVWHRKWKKIAKQRTEEQ